MDNHFGLMTKRLLFIACLTFICAAFNSCSDDYDLDDEGNYPSWLGSSIYEALENPNQEVLTGTFENYLKLVDDLDYKEVLAKTGSNTVFVANDEAFERFYADNTWGVSSYDDLTTAMKKQLLYSSMLTNALLLEMLSNVSSGDSDDPIERGIAIKHTTGANVIDTIQSIIGEENFPVNNSYWKRYYNNGIHVVKDGTKPMMVHFTQQQMTVNDITTIGDESDFEVITGSPYTEGSAYIFRNKVINSDVTCQNGYIQQLEDVLVPPGNIAELIRTNGESYLFARMLDRFCAPYYNSTVTNNYNDYAQIQGLSLIDSVFEWRYFSERSQSKSSGVTTDPDGNSIITDIQLPYDPGWNTYTNSSSGSDDLSDICVIFVPTDEAMKEYLLPGGSGSFLMDAYGKKDNTEENIEENIDSIPMNIVQAFLSNLMKSSFVTAVPSKFDNIVDDGSGDAMGLSLSDLNVNSDGTYDVKIADNGVAYMMNTVYAPAKYVAVSAPALLSDDMKVMNWAIQDKSTLNLNFYAYLLAMSSNYALFIPDDAAFAEFYIDPCYLGHESTSSQPGGRALKFYYDANETIPLQVAVYSYDQSTNTIGDSIGKVAVSTVTTQMTDILNYHTVVLGSGETLGSNTYYKTKHGGEIKIEGGESPTAVYGAAQIDNGLPASNITKTYGESNGNTYRIDHVIQAPQNSVYKILSTTSRFSEFYSLCQSSSDVMSWAGISEKENSYGTSEQDKYMVFISDNGLDYNVSFFNTYNYTVYVPDNDAMEDAYSAGLPTWAELEAIQDSVSDLDETSDEYISAQEKVKLMVEEINKFIRYHFQDNAIYVDNTIEGGRYLTQCADTLGIYQELTVSGSDGQLVVTDARGVSQTIDSSSGIINSMARDYVFDNAAKSASSITTSSFAVIHEIKSPLYYEDKERFDDTWSSRAAVIKNIKTWRKSMDWYLNNNKR